MSHIVNRRRSVLHDLGTYQPVFVFPYSMQDFLLPHFDNYPQDTRMIPTEPTGLYKQYAPQAKHQNHQVVPSSVVLPDPDIAAYSQCILYGVTKPTITTNSFHKIQLQKFAQALFGESFDGSAMRYAACNLNVLSECQSNTYSMLDFTDEDIKMGEECLEMNEDSPEPFTTQLDPQIQPKVQPLIQPQIQPIVLSSTRSYRDYIRWSSGTHDYVTPKFSVINESKMKLKKTCDVSNNDVHQRITLSAADQPRQLTTSRKDSHDTPNTLTYKVIDIKKEISSDTTTSICDIANIVSKSSIKRKRSSLYYMTCKHRKTN